MPNGSLHPPHHANVARARGGVVARALDALLYHALRGTRSGGCVTMRATTLADRRARRADVTITVTHSPTAGAPRTGSGRAADPGLVAAWLLVEDEGGAIGATCEPDGNGAFWVALPAA